MEPCSRITQEVEAEILGHSPLTQGKELTAANAAVAVVGKGTAFKIIEDDEIQPYIDMIDAEDAPAPEPAGDAGDDMATDA